MAIPWLVLLKTVPWADVISNAPAIADGARKLWKKVGGTGATPEPMPPAPIVVPPGGDVVQALRTRVEHLSAETRMLQQELQTSSELIKALADQNTLLVERVEAHRVRLRWLSALVLLMGLGLAGLWWRLA
jgi:hypothetical protein